jgi:hypothetical protein
LLKDCVGVSTWMVETLFTVLGSEGCRCGVAGAGRELAVYASVVASRRIEGARDLLSPFEPSEATIEYSASRRG